MSRKQFKMFEEAREYVKKLGLKSKKEWYQYRKSDKRPSDIPSAPEAVYKDKGWISWGDWLGTGRIASYDIIFKPFEEAREYVRKLGLKSKKEWELYCKSGKRPNDIPSSPYEYYKNKGWINWGDWLENEFKSFEEAREFVRKLGLKNVEEWYQYRKSGKRPSDIPSDPHGYYKNKGWKGMGDWLGTERKPLVTKPCPFEEWCKTVRKMGVKSSRDYRRRYKTREFPENFPSSPNIVYVKKSKKKQKQLIFS